MKNPFKNLFTNAAPRAGRARARALSATVDTLNRNYRDYLNPARGLTVTRAVSLAESYMRGEFADLMWTFGAPFVGIECGDPDLVALIARRADPLLEMDWDPLIVAREGIDDKLAEDQQAFIRELMDGVTNLYAAIEHMALASFRGFSHCEQIRDFDGTLRELRPVQQWNIVRDGSTGRWRYNPDAKQCGYRSLGPEMDIDPASWLIRVCPRPIHRISLLKYVCENLSSKDWDAFIEIYGIPGGVVTGPQEVPEGKEDEYQTAGVSIAEGGSGYLPYGSTWTPNVLPRGNQPFKERLDHLSQKLVLAGTGGFLTMLAHSGTGTLAGSAHMETFKTLARGEARRISELIDTQIVRPRVEARWPGKPVLAYWALAANEEIKVSDIVEHASKLSTAGYRIDRDELAEKTGYKLEEEPETPPEDKKPTDPGDKTGLASHAEGLQGPEQDEEAPTPAANRSAPLSERVMKLAQRGALGTQMAGLIDRMEQGDTDAAEEALRLISEQGPAALADIAPLTQLIGRLAEEAAVRGAIGMDPPAKTAPHSSKDTQ